MSSQPDASQLSTLNSRILKQYWGYDCFRGIQEDIIDSISKNKDTLGLMPTGGGKSITFQVPALAKEGMCLVITPLIALMKDQVQNLKKRGIKALAIYSGMSRQDIIITLENCIFGNYKFLYISPERLDTEIFRTKLRKMHISMITVDESHCISQWGYDFRPAYLKIAEIRELLPDVPVLALTATATPEVVKDIQARLHFRHKNVFRMSFERNNLAYIVRKTENKTAELLHILRSMPGSAIVYVRNRRRTKEITELLNNEHITADFYHAGLPGAIIATLGCVFPSCVIVLALAYVYYHYKGLDVIQGILAGLRPAVVAMIASAGLSLLVLALWGEEGQISLSHLDWVAAGIFAVALVVLRRWKPDPILVMAGAGAAGAILYHFL